VWLCAGAAGVADAGPHAPASSISVRDGVYTAAQALRGRTTFQDTCSWCHPDPFWRPSWAGKPLGELYGFALKAMPEDNPGSLTPGQAADVFAYILESNGFPAGARELAADAGALERILLEEPEPDNSP
jgi:hypothetical protein